MEVGQVVSNNDVVGTQCFYEVDLGGTGGDGSDSANTITRGYEYSVQKERPAPLGFGQKYLQTLHKTGTYLRGKASHSRRPNATRRASDQQVAIAQRQRSLRVTKLPLRSPVRRGAAAHESALPHGAEGGHDRRSVDRAPPGRRPHERSLVYGTVYVQRVTRWR